MSQFIEPIKDIVEKYLESLGKENILIIVTSVCASLAYIRSDAFQSSRIREMYDDVLTEYLKGNFSRDDYRKLFDQLPRTIGYFSYTAKKESQKVHQVIMDEKMKDSIELIRKHATKKDHMGSKEFLEEVRKRS